MATLGQADASGRAALTQDTHPEHPPTKDAGRKTGHGAAQSVEATNERTR